MDTALRRRFRFVEMMPNAEILRGSYTAPNGFDIVKMLETINKRIELLYDREHMIGHSYFMPFMNDPTAETLRTIFLRSVIPLLQEYFYEDYQKIQLVLGDNGKADSEKFILDEPVKADLIFNAS